MYTATVEQMAAFDREHDYLKSHLELGKEVIWLTRDQCIECGPDKDEVLKLVRETMILPCDACVCPGAGCARDQVDRVLSAQPASVRSAADHGPADHE